MTCVYNRLPEKVKRQEFRKNSTHAEKILWVEIRKRKISGKKFRRQYSAGPYILDFYCPQLRLSIEIDGPVHFEMDRIEYDQVRKEYINSIGITEIRFTNEEIFKNLNQVITKITDKIENMQ